MHFLTIVVRYFPYWALPLVAGLYELGVYFRRRNQSLQWVIWGFAGFLVLLSLLWLIFRGDKNSDQWVLSLFG